MSVNVMDGFGLLFSFAVIAGAILGILRSYYQFKQERSYKMPIMENEDNGEFESDDIDRDVDEMPDDSLIYDIFN